MIPRTIHQIWLGKKPMPPEHVKFRDNIIRMHPDWEVKMWVDEHYKDNEEFHLWKEQATSLASISNWMRLDILYNHGGIYLDTDVEVLRPLDPALAYRAFIADQGDGIQCNAVMGAERKNPWIKWQLDHSWMFRNSDAGWGPKVATMAPEYRDNWRMVTYLPTELLYPWGWSDKPDRSRITKDTYTVHHWDNSWNK